LFGGLGNASPFLDHSFVVWEVAWESAAVDSASSKGDDTTFPFETEASGFISGDWNREERLEDLEFLLPQLIIIYNCNKTENEKLRVTDDIFEAVFVTAARTPPSTLSLAVPFFLPFFVGICTPADEAL
jgi:hypothetical protein